MRQAVWVSVVSALGLDLSLTATGVASSAGWARQIKTRAVPAKLAKDVQTRMTVERLQRIGSEVHALLLDRPELVCIEGPSFGSKNGQAHERGGLWWRVVEDLQTRGIPYAVVAPGTLKKYATGDGQCDKTAMAFAAARRLPFDSLPDDNCVDAAWLAAMAHERLTGEPLAPLPKAQREAMGKVDWPEVTT